MEIKVRNDVDPYKLVFSQVEQLRMSRTDNAARHYLVSPYFFMYATLLAHDPNNPHAEEQGEEIEEGVGEAEPSSLSVTEAFVLGVPFLPARAS